MTTSTLTPSTSPKVISVTDDLEHLAKSTAVVIDEMTDLLDEFSDTIITGGPSTFLEQGVRHFTYEGDASILAYELGAKEGHAIAKLVVSIPSLSIDEFEIINEVYDTAPDGGVGKAIDASITATRNDAFDDDVDHVISYSVVQSLNNAYYTALIRSQ